MTPALERLLAVMAAGRGDEGRIISAYTDYLRDFGLDHFTLGFIDGATETAPGALRIWTSLSDDWMEEYYAQGYPVHDYVLHQVEALDAGRPLSAFEWGVHLADRDHVAPTTRPVLAGVADAGLAAAMSFAGRHVEAGAERRFAASFGCATASMAETRRRIEAHRNELVIAAFALAPLLAPELERTGPAEGRSPLTGRERDVLARFAQGLRPERIADRMGLSKRTVDMHAANARRKLKARTLAEAVATGVRRGLI
ncbi:LuxR C-terminal-related transcriptional regulator [Brevundimonas sp. FT23042]|uniref:helix-turn-helix transcriptional regulator n=1 Tax=Brevundimonas sp. FT23042 TaxID=3393749 RepID=UPI003B58895E